MRTVCDIEKGGEEVWHSSSAGTVNGSGFLSLE